MNDRLTSFYFGALDEKDRLDVERELLSDPELLLDYLELKRSVEAAAPVPQTPSASFRRRLQAALPPRRRRVLQWAAGAAAALLLLWSAFHFSDHETDEPFRNGVLFDRGGEHSPVSNVL